jgi:hypothetical protein
VTYDELGWDAAISNTITMGSLINEFTYFSILILAVV